MNNTSRQAVLRSLSCSEISEDLCANVSAVTVQDADDVLAVASNVEDERIKQIDIVIEG
jgi:hypothetical protein